MNFFESYNFCVINFSALFDCDVYRESHIEHYQTGIILIKYYIL